MAKKKAKSAVSRDVKIRDRLSEIRGIVESSYIEFSQLLREVWANAYYLKWGYETLREYAEDELGIQYRRARYFIGIADAVAELKLDWDDIREIGWTSMRTVLPVLTKDNAKSWLDRAENTSRRELQKQVQDARGAVSRGESKNITIKLTLSEAESSIIMSALDKAKEMISNESSSLAMEHICYEWFQASGNSPEKVDLEGVLDWVQRSYGVDVAVSEGQDIEALVN